MRHFFFLSFFLIHFVYIYATDTLTLIQCRQWAVEYSPLIKQESLIKERLFVEKKTLNTGYLPQATLEAKGSYQSNVTHIPVISPNMQFNLLSKDHYRAELGFTQIVYDGGYLNRQKKIKEMDASLDKKRNQIDLYDLQDRITNYYLNLILLKEQQKIAEILISDIKSNIKQLQAAYVNGVTLKTNINHLEIELLKAEQRMTELQYGQREILDLLSGLTGRTFSDQIEILTPQPPEIRKDEESKRPEFAMFDLQKQYIDRQAELIESKVIPKLFLFASGGYGLPGLNMLQNKFNWYYIAGIKLSVPLTEWSTLYKEKRLLSIQKENIDTQHANYTLNNSLQLKQQLSEIDKYDDLIRQDHVIFAKQKQIREVSWAQLQNGVITPTDYLINLNAEAQSLQNLKLHEVQCLQAKLRYQLLVGNE